MEHKTRKEVLADEIATLTKLIEDARKKKKNTLNKHRSQLIKLILELDALGKDDEKKDSD